MKSEPTPAQERSLVKLFSGNQQDREQVISMHSPQMQKQLRGLIKAKDNSEKLFQIMFADLKHASGEMKANADNQFWRRTTIRTVAATVEGIIFCFKQTAHATGVMNGFTFSAKELSFLNEGVSVSEVGKKQRFSSFRENLKDTFKLFAKANKTSCPTDFNSDGFAALCETYELRHRLVHPKSYMTFCVNDQEKERAGEAIYWLNNEIKNLLETCSRRYQIDQD